MPFAHQRQRKCLALFARRADFWGENYESMRLGVHVYIYIYMRLRVRINGLSYRCLAQGASIFCGCVLDNRQTNDNGDRISAGSGIPFEMLVKFFLDRGCKASGALATCSQVFACRRSLILLPRSIPNMYSNLQTNPMFAFPRKGCVVFNHTARARNK